MPEQLTLPLHAYGPPEPPWWLPEPVVTQQPSGQWECLGDTMHVIRPTEAEARKDYKWLRRTLRNHKV